MVHENFYFAVRVRLHTFVVIVLERIITAAAHVILCYIFLVLYEEEPKPSIRMLVFDLVWNKEFFEVIEVSFLYD